MLPNGTQHSATCRNTPRLARTMPSPTPRANVANPRPNVQPPSSSKFAGQAQTDHRSVTHSRPAFKPNHKFAKPFSAIEAPSSGTSPALHPSAAPRRTSPPLLLLSKNKFTDPAILNRRVGHLQSNAPDNCSPSHPARDSRRAAGTYCRRRGERISSPLCDSTGRRARINDVRQPNRANAHGLRRPPT